MPKNIKGGKKAKGLKNSGISNKNRDIPVPSDDDDSHIALITKIQGDSRFLCQIVNSYGLQNKVYPVNLSKGTFNKFGRGIIIGTSTYVLISIREFQKDKGDIIFIYQDSEIPYLVSIGHMITINRDTNADSDKNFIFSNTDNNQPLEPLFDFSDI
jgi:hypothetical protein